jgi:hypothetical protein
MRFAGEAVMNSLRADSKSTMAKPATLPGGRGARDEARPTQDRTGQRTSTQDPADVELYNLPFTD